MDLGAVVEVMKKYKNEDIYILKDIAESMGVHSLQTFNIILDRIGHPYYLDPEMHRLHREETSQQEGSVSAPDQSSS